MYSFSRTVSPRNSSTLSFCPCRACVFTGGRSSFSCRLSGLSWVLSSLFALSGACSIPEKAMTHFFHFLCSALRFESLPFLLLVADDFYLYTSFLFFLAPWFLDRIGFWCALPPSFLSWTCAILFLSPPVFFFSNMSARFRPYFLTERPPQSAYGFLSPRHPTSSGMLSFLQSTFFRPLPDAHSPFLTRVFSEKCVRLCRKPRQMRSSPPPL